MNSPHRFLEMKKLALTILSAFLFCFCETNENSGQKKEEITNSVEPVNFTEKKEKQNENGLTIEDRFVPKDGFRRIEIDENSFENYLRQLPLKPSGSPVFYFDGREKYRQDVHAAVIDLDVGKRDLQQCADAIMRLRAEYLFAQKNYVDIHFNFVSGFNAEYVKWRKGNRIKVNGNTVSWTPTQRESESYESFRKYLDMVFSYAGTLSLAKELTKVSINEMQIGDVFIQGGSPGHAVIVIDMAVNERTKEKQFLLAQSYMPAQDIHVLKNPEGGVWYDLNFGNELNTPEWNFSKNDLKRF